jgi:hypothetical protein
MGHNGMKQAPHPSPSVVLASLDSSLHMFCPTVQAPLIDVPVWRQLLYRLLVHDKPDVAQQAAAALGLAE